MSLIVVGIIYMIAGCVFFCCGNSLDDITTTLSSDQIQDYVNIGLFIFIVGCGVLVTGIILARKSNKSNTYTNHNYQANNMNSSINQNINPITNSNQAVNNSDKIRMPRIELLNNLYTRKLITDKEYNLKYQEIITQTQLQQNINRR